MSNFTKASGAQRSKILQTQTPEALRNYCQAHLLQAMQIFVIGRPELSYDFLFYFYPVSASGPGARGGESKPIA